MNKSDGQVRLVYRHSCQCSHRGQLVERWLPIVDGTVEFPRPVCAQTRVELELISADLAVGQPGDAIVNLRGC